MITLDDYQATGTVMALAAVFMLAVGIAHQTGVAEATAHDRCEGCGRDVCPCDPNQLTQCLGTVLQGCAHLRVLCTDCLTECSSCRDDLAIEAYLWGDR